MKKTYGFVPKKKGKAEFEITFKTAAELLEERKTLKKFSTLTPIDELIGGGIEEGEIIEVSGEYGSGKTQLCHTVLCTINEPAVWIDTERTYKPERPAEIAQKRGLDPKEVLSRVHICTATTTEEQMETLKHLKQINPKLIIVDSLVTLYREEYLGRESLPTRQGQLRTFISQLKKYARENKAIGIVTNQVIANPDQLPFMTYEQKVLVCGGHTVYHSIDARIQIRKASLNKRIARLIDSSLYPPNETVFQITDRGIQAVDPELERKGE